MSNDIQGIGEVSFDLAALPPEVLGELAELSNPSVGRWPTIQWTNNRKAVELGSGGHPPLGGFVMTESNAVNAGNFPENGIKAIS